MRDTLPPGPRMPQTLQAVAWARRPLGFLERCQKHFGDTFTIRVRHAGTWVILADPEDVKKVFTADHAVLGVGLANSVLGPLLGPRSLPCGALCAAVDEAGDLDCSERNRLAARRAPLGAAT